MQWNDEGYLLSKNRYGENSSIVEFYTSNNGKVTAQEDSTPSHITLMEIAA